MGMFDTIIFEKPIMCVKCGTAIFDVQTKSFESTLESFHICDCIGHAEDMRIVKEWLFCATDSCIASDDKQYVYIAVKHGILLGVTETLPEAEKLITEHNYEKLVFMYFDQYRKRLRSSNECRRVLRFLSDAEEWFGDRSKRKAPLAFLNANKELLENSSDLADALRKFLKQEEQKGNSIIS